ncbi:unnamed protein product [Caenorhabditis angaria]|uniref:Uncharacterized protein n=1 Tax=Caenorhabditis angaria TaxID=860376 RepID=A0A9P1IJZ2_9PELO|nr:unnamed protein product [Caenorhabditis angaria]
MYLLCWLQEDFIFMSTFTNFYCQFWHHFLVALWPRKKKMPRNRPELDDYSKKAAKNVEIDNCTKFFLPVLAAVNK